MSEKPSPLEFLEAVYCNEGLELHVRLKAAIEAAQYRHPKLGAVAHANMNSDTFAAMLDKAIERSGTAMKQIEHQPDDPS